MNIIIIKLHFFSRKLNFLDKINEGRRRMKNVNNNIIKRTVRMKEAFRFIGETGYS